MIDQPHARTPKLQKSAGLPIKLCKAPVFLGFLGSVLVFFSFDAVHATIFAQGVMLAVAALAVAAGFYMRSSVPHAGLMLFRLFIALIVKWAILLGGAGYVLAHGCVAPGAFVAGIVTALVATLFGRGLND